jgi:hypothetical protein
MWQALVALAAFLGLGLVRGILPVLYTIRVLEVTVVKTALIPFAELCHMILSLNGCYVSFMRSVRVVRFELTLASS